MFKSIISLATFACAASAASVRRHDHDECTSSVVDVLAGDDFGTLAAALGASGIPLDALVGTTVFAPTNDAFAALPNGTVESLLLPENQETLVSILTYHVTTEEYELGSNATISTLNGQNLTIDCAHDNCTINTNTLIIAGPVATCENVTLYVIDSVLLPAAEARNTEVDVDEVELAEAEAEESDFCTSVADVLAGEDFSTLAAALGASSIPLDALVGTTVFAPTNDAFAGLPEGTVEFLLQPENQGALDSILKYHVSGEEYELGEDETIATLNGQDLVIECADGDCVINGNTNIVAGPVETCEDVTVYVINRVLLPEEA